MADQTPFHVVASVSGGKDSAAMALHFAELGIPFERVFCDTGWEHRDTYAYIRETLEPAIGPIKWLPMQAWTWRPLREWAEADVIAIHKRHGLKPNPLYIRGASRVGCWPCIFARKAEVAMVARDDDARIRVIERLERVLTDKAVGRAVERAKTPVPDGLDDDAREVAQQLRDPGHWRNQRTFFGAGDKGRNWDFYDIRKTVEWANTDRGGRQFSMFSPLDEAAADGCMRWGLCETENAS